VLLASSDLLELLGLCDRIVVLHDRAVSGELDRSQASEQAIALLSAGGGMAHAG
jgi:ABC-type sugar transport system ATPase subunit